MYPGDVKVLFEICAFIATIILAIVALISVFVYLLAPIIAVIILFAFAWWFIKDLR